MLIAYNNDIEFRSKWYHIQTEDNGLKDGHVTTTVFHSGQILDSKSVSYMDAIAGVEDPEAINQIVKDIMVKQHQSFYAKLFEGSYEALVQKRTHVPSQVSPASSQLPSRPMVAPSANFPNTNRMENGGLSSPTKNAGKPDILRASQQVSGVQKGMGIKSLASLSMKPQQSANAPDSQYAQAYHGAVMATNLNVPSIERHPNQDIPVEISKAVEDERFVRASRSWLGFRWPNDDLAIDVLMRTLIESGA